MTLRFRHLNGIREVSAGGGESTPEQDVGRNFDVAASGRRLLLPDTAGRKAWWVRLECPTRQADAS